MTDTPIADALTAGIDISICDDCAKKNGAQAPEDQVTSYWTDDCQVCHRQTMVCAVSDWRWPMQRRVHRQVVAGEQE